MNDEIVVKFGGDLTPLGTSLRSLNKMVKDAGSDMKKSFKEGFGSIGDIISGGAIIAGINHVINKFDELDDRATNLNISTDFLQGMQHIADKDAVGGVNTFNKAITELSSTLGEAKNGSDEALKKFEKWGFTLKDIQELDTEGAFYKIADRIKDIPDPAQRSAAAFELLGKAGKNLVGVMQDGAEAVKGMVDQVDKLDTDKIKQLAEAKSTIQNATNTATIWAGKALGWIGNAAKTVGDWSTGDASGWNDYLSKTHDDIKRAQQASATPTGPVVDSERAQKLLDARDKYLHARAMEGDDLTKLNGLVGERHRIQSEINKLQGESVEKYKLMTEYAHNEKAITELQSTITKSKNEAQAKADKERKKHLEDEKNLTQQINKARNDLGYTDWKREQALMAPYMPSLQDLANSGYATFRHNQMEWQQGPFAQQAQEILRLQADAKDSLIWGNKGRFEKDISRIEDLKAGLRDAGVLSADETLESIDKTLVDSKQHLASLLEKASGKGIRVIGGDDDE